MMRVLLVLSIAGFVTLSADPTPPLDHVAIAESNGEPTADSTTVDYHGSVTPPPFCSPNIDGPCAFSCLDNLAFAVYLRGDVDSTITGSCSTTSATCTITTGNACSKTSGQATNLDQGTCSITTDGGATGLCYGPVCGPVCAPELRAELDARAAQMLADWLASQPV